MPEIYVNNKSYSCLNINISAGASFKVILATINNIELKGLELSQEHLRYALLELVNNSLRAHREQNCKKGIKLRIKALDWGYSMEIMDWGGGFDTSRLPFNISEHYDKIDMESQRFQEYREKNQYKRFGMGLLSAKKVFDQFEINFHRNGVSTSYIPGETDGTTIILGVKINEQ